MRFTSDGPSIPEELLEARDEGRVVFFCGAGVSLAKAGLPSFFGLAETVLKDLGAEENCDARKVFRKAQEIGEELNVAGLISADRIFGLLERDFTDEQIQDAVARALRPQMNPDLTAHRIILRLAKCPAANTQLVTTNFDRLFEACDSKLLSRQAPHLPNLSRSEALDGIVYLHGRVKDDYTAAEGPLVLSSSEFGSAYLSEGWATEFFREIVRSYCVVFVGYKADDPPIQYLLEGFRKKLDPARKLYAFQPHDEDVGQWYYKGVEPIAYSGVEKHRALWEALERWAERADEPQLWRGKVIDMAMRGPEALPPHERGQVAHVVKTVEGARQFAERLPPAEWLCVFDPHCRYELPPSSHGFPEEEPVVDPFTRYGLDSDITPERNAKDRWVAEKSKEEIIEKAWDAFVWNSDDRKNISDVNLATVRGHFATHLPQLPKRISSLCRWISDIAHQPAVVWWVVRQGSLHPSLWGNIEWELKRNQNKFSPALSKAWRYLLEAKDQTRNNFPKSHGMIT